MLKDKDETTEMNDMVASGLAKDQEKQEENESAEKKECLVETLDGEIAADAEEEKEGEENNGDSPVPTKVALKKNLSGEDDAENVEAEKDKEPIKVGVVVPQVNSAFQEEEDKADTDKDPEEEIPEVFTPKNDYSLMDELMGFLEIPEEREDNEARLEPILCGYFNKVMTALLSKQKGKTLEYLLLFQKGKIFDNLLSHMQHFSLASLLLHLLGMKFHLEDYTGFNNVAQ